MQSVTWNRVCIRRGWTIEKPHSEIFTSIFPSVSLHICMCALMCVVVCIGICGLKDNSSIHHPQGCQSCSSRQGISFACSSSIRLNWLASKIPERLLFCLPTSRFTSSHYHTQLCNMGSKEQTPPLCLQGKHFVYSFRALKLYFTALKVKNLGNLPRKKNGMGQG